MTFLSRIKHHALQAMLLLPTLACIHATAAGAAASPAAMSTLDVCHNAATGHWRYSGVVSVAGSAVKPSTVIGVDYWLQNMASPSGYADALRVPSVSAGATSVASAGARLTRFEVEGPAFSVGTLRNSARIVVADLLAPSATPLLLHATADFAQAVCGCSNPSGCTRTQGYWKSKPDVLWPAPYNRTTLFFSTGLTWQTIFDTPPQGGNAYLILAHQYMAAVLNRTAGASAPSSVQTVINQATAWFSSGVGLGTCSGSACATQKNWAAILDTYNNGEYPGAPPHCPD